MKRFRYSIALSLNYFVAAILVVVIVTPQGSVYAQTPAKKSLSQALITYPGDTEKTIARRIQWTEGAKKEGKVTWWGSDNPAIVKGIAAEFNKVYPFIALDHWRGQDNERISRIEAENSIGRLSVDFCAVGDPTNFTRWRKSGLVERYTDIILGLEKMDRRSYSKYGDWALIGNNATVPSYNTKLVSASEAPKSWEDLLNPVWKGKIGMTADMRVWYVLALGEGGWGIEKTETFLRKLKQQEPIWAQGHSAGHNLLIAGEFKIMAEDFLRNVYASQKKGGPVERVKVSPVAITGVLHLLVKKAPHPNAARLFIEWLFSPPGQATYEKFTGYGSAAPGSGSQIAKGLAGATLVYRTEEVILKTAELKLIERFANILGVTAE